MYCGCHHAAHWSKDVLSAVDIAPTVELHTLARMLSVDMMLATDSK